MRISDWSSDVCSSDLVAARVGEPHRVGPFSVTLEGIRPVVGDNWSALEAKLVARRGEGAPIVLRPQSRFFSAPPTVTSESAIATRLAGQLYTVLGQADDQGRWRSEVRRVGKECVSRCSSRGAP